LAGALGGNSRTGIIRFHRNLSGGKKKRFVGEKVMSLFNRPPSFLRPGRKGKGKDLPFSRVPQHMKGGTQKESGNNGVPYVG